MDEQIQQANNFKFGNIFRYVLVALVFILPIFFIPSTTFPLYSAKISILTTFLIALIALFLTKTLSTGTISIPKTRILVPLALFPIITLISSFFSKNIMGSIVGDVFDIGTSGSFLILTLLFFLVLFAVKGERQTVGQTLKYFIYSGIVVILHMLVRAFLASVLPVALASRIPNFLVGGAIDTAILLGTTVLGTLCLLHMTQVGKRMTYIMYATLFISMLIIGAVNFSPVIYILGIFALIYFVFIFSWSLGGQNSIIVGAKNYIPALLILAFSVILIISGGAVSRYLSNLLNVNTFEVRPNVATTFEIVKESIKVNPILGVGPNGFTQMWNLHKPIAVNTTDFWNTNFSFGSSLLTTLLSTVGILGFLSVISFIVMYVVLGFRSLFVHSDDGELNYGMVTTFFISLFLWIMTFVYVPGLSILSLAFIFSALFVSTISERGIISSREFNLFANPKANFVAVFGIVFFLLLSIAGGYFVWQRNIARNTFQKALVTASLGNIEETKLGMAKAIEMAGTDTYWRSLAEITLTELSQVLGTITNPQNISETKRVEIQTVISNSIEAARQAIALNPNNYQNWFLLGRVYESLASVGIEGSALNAKSAYLEAKNRAPNNPSIPLAFARLEVISGNAEGAKNYITESLGLKNNYTDAYFTLAQIEVANNNIPNAIKSVEVATLTDPNNHNLYFQLGLLNYNNKDFAGAIGAFEKAITLIPDYANARYFLGLSYDKINRAEDAVLQFREIQKTNPDNKEVSLILTNLEAGRDPFSNARPPIDDEPENRDELPIEEDNN